MGQISSQTSLLLFAATSRYDEALAWGLRQSEAEFGGAAAVSDAFDFTETDYYAAEMGEDLKKQFWASVAKLARSLARVTKPKCNGVTQMNALVTITREDE